MVCGLDFKFSVKLSCPAHSHRWYPLAAQYAAKLIKIPRSFKKKLNGSALKKKNGPITTAPGPTALTNTNLRFNSTFKLKVQDLHLWAYTDGRRLTKQVNNVLEQESMLTLAQ